MQHRLYPAYHGLIGLIEAMMLFVSSGYRVNFVLSPTLVRVSKLGEATLSTMVIAG